MAQYMAPVQRPTCSSLPWLRYIRSAVLSAFI